MKRKLPSGIVSIALLVASQVAVAQVPRGAGGQLLQIPPAPAAPRAGPEISIRPQAAPAADAPAADAVRIVVQDLRITGARALPVAELVAAAGFTPGSEVSLADLQAMAARITEHYRARGYFVATAYLPAQDIQDHAVTIAVSEGRYGQVEVRNASRLSERVARGSMEGLHSGDPILLEPLERRLLRLSDVPGVNVRSTLVPGPTPGTSDLLVDITPGRAVSGSIDADNAGNRYTGEYRVGATLYVNNPLGLGDVASLRLLTSGDGLKYGRVAYELQAGRGQVGAAYSWLGYSLGKEFESLQAHGTADITSVFGRYPLVRSRNDNLYAQLEFDYKRFTDHVDSIPAVVDRNSRVLMASLYGDHRDDWYGGGLNSWFLTWSTGQLDIETPNVRAVDEATARTNGHFDKIAFQATRVQRLGGPFSLSAGIGGQLASRNLDVSEKMELGGMNAVRAYPEGEAYADQGFIVSLEARMDLPRFSPALPGHMQLVAFVDSGHVTVNKEPWFAGPNQRNLSGAGIGATWADPGNFLLRAYYAHKLGNEPALSAPDKSGRFWLQAVKFF
jgi:hemolysin activation/secretion protein